ncbi:hypothetical protein FIBSPDRAFT_848458 [Athelia psychrophila]|uniref:Uncharacterized protein n=1 Tax=Athelia psychrophila TaxID=1759441 RepID=A0A166VEU2_9AGAM|nr:hypothetical protein FIBSPDRAFT_848458 [Fibularhizoctonia sp. CBS 109695]
MSTRYIHVEGYQQAYQSSTLIEIPGACAIFQHHETSDRDLQYKLQNQVDGFTRALLASVFPCGLGSVSRHPTISYNAVLYSNQYQKPRNSKVL